MFSVAPAPRNSCQGGCSLNRDSSECLPNKAPQKLSSRAGQVVQGQLSCILKLLVWKKIVSNRLPNNSNSVFDYKRPEKGTYELRCIDAALAVSS